MWLAEPCRGALRPVHARHRHRLVCSAFASPLSAAPEQPHAAASCSGEVLPRLRENVAANTAGAGCTPEVGFDAPSSAPLCITCAHSQVLELDWSDTAALAALPRAQLLLAADVAYGMSDDLGEGGAKAAEVLANALTALAAPRAVVLLAQLVRLTWLFCAYS